MQRLLPRLQINEAFSVVVSFKHFQGCVVGVLGLVELT